MCVYSKFIHSPWLPGWLVVWLVVCCDFIGDISPGIDPSVKYKYSYRWWIWYRWHSRFAFRFFCSLPPLFFSSVDSQTYIRIYNTRSTTICCNLYVSLFHICAWSTTNTIEDEPFECEQCRGTICTAKMMERNVKKIVCKLVICILCGPSGRSLFLHQRSLFPLYFSPFNIRLLLFSFPWISYFFFLFRMVYLAFSPHSIGFCPWVFILSFLFQRYNIQKAKAKNKSKNTRKNANKNENRSWKIFEVQTILIL